MKWFVNHTCLFLLGDVWSKPVDGTAYLEALSRIFAGGKHSALIFSTREKRLISHKSVTHDVRLLTHELRGNFRVLLYFEPPQATRVRLSTRPETFS